MDKVESAKARLNREYGPSSIKGGWLCLSPNMLDVISSCAGNVYFVDRSRCAVKMDGIVVNLLRRCDEWYVTSSSKRFYDLVGRYGKSTKRGDLIRLSELQMIGVLKYMAKTNGAE